MMITVNMNMLTPNLGEIPALCRKDERPCCSRFLDLLEALCEFFGRYDFALEVAGKYMGFHQNQFFRYSGPLRSLIMQL